MVRVFLLILEQEEKARRADKAERNWHDDSAGMQSINRPFTSAAGAHHRLKEGTQRKSSLSLFPSVALSASFRFVHATEMQNAHSEEGASVRLYVRCARTIKRLPLYTRLLLTLLFSIFASLPLSLSLFFFLCLVFLAHSTADKVKVQRRRKRRRKGLASFFRPSRLSLVSAQRKRRKDVEREKRKRRSNGFVLSLPSYVLTNLHASLPLLLLLCFELLKLFLLLRRLFLLLSSSRRPLRSAWNLLSCVADLSSVLCSFFLFSKHTRLVCLSAALARLEEAEGLKAFFHSSCQLCFA